MLARIETAHDVRFGTYFLSSGRMRDALAGAARRGAHVAVTVQRAPYRDRAGVREEITRASAAVLREAGARVTLLPSDTAPFHCKAAVVDGVAFLDDRNWTVRGPEVVVADDDPADVRLVTQALAGHGRANPTLSTRKDEALAREVMLIESAPCAPVVVETETLGASPLSAALRRHAKRGAPTTLIVGRDGTHTERQRSLLAGLRNAGVDVRENGVNQKLALAGDAAWIGSANGTFARDRVAAGQIDWGILTEDPLLVGAARAALERDAAT